MALVMQEPKVSVVVVSYNTRDKLRRCLACIEPAHEVIVVDNASSDGSPEMVVEEYPHVRLLANGANVGFGAANNQGVEIARGEVILFLNSDCYAEPGAIARLAEAFADRDIVAAGGRLLNPDGSLQESAANELTLWAVFCEQTLLEKAFPKSRLLSPYWVTRHLGASGRVPVAQVMGACLMMRRTAPRPLRVAEGAGGGGSGCPSAPGRAVEDHFPDTLASPPPVPEQKGRETEPPTPSPSVKPQTTSHKPQPSRKWHGEHFDERYFLYCEDTDLCKRLSRYGRIVYDPQAVFIHELGSSSSAMRWRAVALYNCGKELYFRIHHGPIPMALCWLLDRLGALLRLLIWGIMTVATLFLLPRLRRQSLLFLRVLTAPLRGPARPRKPEAPPSAARSS